jgi:hypothetical protein
MTGRAFTTAARHVTEVTVAPSLQQHTTMFFGGQSANPVLSPMLAYPTEILRQIYAMPLFPQSFLPFNLLFTLNAIRLNIEFHKAQRGADKAYLHVPQTSLSELIFRVC